MSNDKPSPWTHYTFSLEEAQSEAERRPGWQTCLSCRRDWVPVVTRPLDVEINRLCGFDVVAAMNKLWALHHQEHAVESASKAYREAYFHLFNTRQLLAPERLSQRSVVEALVALRASIGGFRAAVEASRDLWRWNSTWVIFQRAAAVSSILDRYLRYLELRWSFDSGGRSLPGTKHTRGRQPKRLLAEIESMLREGGIAANRIATLDLDGALAQSTTATVGGDAASRVRMRAGKLRKRRRDEGEA